MATTRANIKDVPEDFRLHAANENDTQLGNRYGITRRQAARMRRNLGIQSTHPRAAGNRPLPDDFAEIAGNRTNAQVAAHYGVGDKTVLRWRKESGITVRGVVVARQTGRSSGIPYQRVFSDTRPVGLAADAAQFLRGKGFVVYNRVVESKALEGQYAVGRMRFETPEAMIAYARERGF